MRPILAFVLMTCACGGTPPTQEFDSGSACGAGCDLAGTYEVVATSTHPTCSLPSHRVTVEALADGGLNATTDLSSLCSSSAASAVVLEACRIKVTAAASCTAFSEPQGFTYSISFSTCGGAATAQWGRDWCPTYPRQVRPYEVTVKRAR